ncbi:MAG: nicotinamidase [Gammaproteobacteria bacterium CG_4_10_14_0_8_um_filter_38_16]|nr:MAG: nicotinamidase [Gammaproteobacteria bacterium CG_4_10_14_0_8_um_filter_38_16]PJA03495.1 MAG: nicotinamidase [Gammaproteobacteria bacterium CG_4_10_14_0_2_um_filter_38_22]PJB10647.1 MAG: nicotinamidase [Gammaproteobacteria bacterium CG_4_9_14_3_um_filter_38_9]
MLKDTALLLIDLQNDFCLGGSLAVPHADEVISVGNAQMKLFQTVIATQDWHPDNHMSFETLWPAHCIQHTKGAAFHTDLNLSSIHYIVQKGTDPTIDSYSAFYDNQHLKATGLTQQLRDKNITTVYVMGLATDYCVKYSCLDALADGFRVYVIEKGCRAVNVQSGDSEKAWYELIEKGCVLV